MWRRLLPAIAAFGLSLNLVPPASAITVKTVNAAALKKTIASYKGKVVLVNFWATWCIPCVKEFPGLVQISHQDKSRGLVVLAVSGDKPKDIPAKVQPFLKRQGASFPQYIIGGDLDAFVNAFRSQWQADFPQTFVFNKQGRLVKELAGEQTVSTWQAAVAPLLAVR